MNTGITIVNNSSKEELSMDQIRTQEFILDAVDWGQVDLTAHTSKYLNQIGVTVTGTSIETRFVEISGWIVARSEAIMTNRKQKLNLFFNITHDFSLIYTDYRLDFLLESSVAYSATASENNEVVCRFKVRGYCPNPLFSDKKENNVLGATTEPRFMFPLFISKDPNPPGGTLMGYKSPNPIMSIINKGIVETGMKIVFKAKGTLLNPSLLDIDTREYIKINKVMEPGDIILINTNIGQKRVLGEEESPKGGKVWVNFFKYRDLGSTWLQLHLGVTNLRFDADEDIDNLEVYIYYDNKYLEVQQCM